MIMGSCGLRTSMQPDLSDRIQRLLAGGGIGPLPASISFAESAARYWTVVSEYSGRSVFVKIAAETRLREPLLREVAVTSELLAIGVPTSMPLMSLSEDDLTIAVFELEAGAVRPEE